MRGPRNKSRFTFHVSHFTHPPMNPDTNSEIPLTQFQPQPTERRNGKVARLAKTDPATLRQSLLSDADKFTRFVNSMVRLAEGGIKCELHKFHHQDRCAQAARQKSPSEKPGISDESLRIAEEKLKLL